jgi:hypothetical protein
MAAPATAHHPSTEEYRMSRRLFAVLTAGLLATAPASLHAQSVSLAGGLALPVSDMGNTEQSGYNATLGLNFGAPLVPVGARLEGSISGFNHKNNVAGDTRVMSLTANAIFNMGMPYLIGGLGYYNGKSKFTALGITTEGSSDGAGINIGGGLRFPLGTLSPFVEVRYHQMLGDKNKNVKFVPITFGIQF